SLVRNADQVSVSMEEGATVKVLTVSLSSEDRDLLAGRNNRLMRALNSALSLAGAKTRTRWVLKVAG
ncbi:MAG: hypothetical protein QNK37_38415, partial [Acidobacteriota bacterium]|nr:hypothetical protein [Acidobacteriota bacterium]